MAIDPVMDWKEFVIELQQKILPIYLAHEKKFDPQGVHGRIHICRALVFGEVMARFYQATGVPIDFYAVRVAIAFHDSGREGNGKDRWEQQSADKCFSHLTKQPKFSNNPSEAHRIADRILKIGAWDLLQHNVHDADVLEIMRPDCGHGGLEKFRRDALRFSVDGAQLSGEKVSSDKLREDLIQEAWRFIEGTEAQKVQFFNSPVYMDKLMAWLSERKSQFNILSRVCL